MNNIYKYIYIYWKYKYYHLFRCFLKVIYKEKASVKMRNICTL